MSALCIRLALAIGSLFGAAPLAAAAPIEWQLAHYLPADHFFATGWLTEWVRTIESESQGRLRIVVRPNNELLRLGDIAGGVRDGKAQIGFGPAPDGAVFSLVGLPFVANSATHGARLLARLREQGLLDEPLEGLHVVALHTNAPSIVHSRLRLARVPADLVGQRMRGATPYIRDLLAALGATPIEGFLAPQVYGALRDGKVDGTVFPYEAMGIFRLAEQLRFHTEVPLFVSALGLFVDADALEALPPDLRDLVVRHSGAAASLAAARSWDEEESRGREIARSRGNTIYTPSRREMRDWNRALGPFAAARVAELGATGARLKSAVRAAAVATSTRAR